MQWIGVFFGCVTNPETLSCSTSPEAGGESEVGDSQKHLAEIEKLRSGLAVSVMRGDVTLSQNLSTNNEELM